MPPPPPKQPKAAKAEEGKKGEPFKKSYEETFTFVGGNKSQNPEKEDSKTVLAILWSNCACDGEPGVTHSVKVEEHKENKEKYASLYHDGSYVGRVKVSRDDLNFVRSCRDKGASAVPDLIALPQGDPPKLERSDGKEFNIDPYDPDTFGGHSQVGTGYWRLAGNKDTFPSLQPVGEAKDALVSAVEKMVESNKHRSKKRKAEAKSWKADVMKGINKQQKKKKPKKAKKAAAEAPVIKGTGMRVPSTGA